MSEFETIDLFGALDEVCHIVDGAADSSGKLSAALGSLARNLGMTRGAITLLAADSQDIHIEIAYGHKPAEQSRGHYQPGEGVTGMVIKSGRGMAVPDVSREPLFLNRTRARDLLHEHIAFFCVPLMHDGRPIGALSLECADARPEYEQPLMRVLTVAASLLAPHARRRQNGMRDGGPAAASAAAPVSDARNRASSMIGSADSMRVLFAQIAQAAASDDIVLLRGEPGTGKALAAGAIHETGRRAKRSFVTLDCASLPEHLIGPALFGYKPGHERGALPGTAGKSCIERAKGGTLFVREISALPWGAQEGLLRLIRERVFFHVGGREPCRADVRLIVSSGRELEVLIEQGDFSRELYARIAVFSIPLPPLRARQSDILHLADHAMARHAAESGKGNVRLSLSAMDLLHRYAWPGNVRELENVMERAVLLAGCDGLILPQHLPMELREPKAFEAFGPAFSASTESDGRSLQDRLDEMERAGIVQALVQSRGHMGNAADALGLTERIMALRMRKYGLRYQDYRLRD